VKPDAQTGEHSSVWLNGQGRQLVQQGRYAEAIEVLTSAINVNPFNQEAYLNRAEAHQRLGHFSEATRDLAEAAKLTRGDRPWHQTWWAAAIWIWIPLVFWYGLYVWGWKLNWKERGIVAGTVVGVFATIVVGAVAVGVYRGSSESRMASGDYEKQVVVQVASSRDITDKFGTQLTKLTNDPNLMGRSLIDAAQPILQEYQTGMVDLKRRWATLQPPTEAVEFHTKGAEYFDFEIAMANEALSARTEQELMTVYTEHVDEEDTLSGEFDSLYQELLSHRSGDIARFSSFWREREVRAAN
jgi:tetratricopeptide (TPR) repeat protein